MEFTFLRHGGFLHRRGGFVGKWLLVFLVILCLIGGGGVYAWRYFFAAPPESPPIMTTALSMKFVHEIVDRGSVDSEGNAEVSCEVVTGGELVILYIIPEGTIVKQGDLLIELDSANLQETLTKQQLAVNSSLASVVQCESDLKAAELTYKEYVEGKYPESLANLNNKMFTAEEEMRTAEENWRFNVRLLQKGYITESQVEADLTALKKAQNNYLSAEKEKWVLETYTYEKTVEQSKASIETTKARLASANENLKLDQTRLEYYQKQLTNCTIVSPQDGQVVYSVDRRADDNYVLKEGAKVYSRQKLIKLPDPKRMIVNGIVNEAKIRLVKQGQPVSIELDAFPNQVFQGEVKTVNDFPEPSYSSFAMSREYLTKIRMIDPPPGIKPGLTAKARIIVEEIPDAIVVPVQSIFQFGGKIYAVTYNEGVLDKVEVKTGPSNDKFVVITEGMAAGDTFVLSAWQYRDQLDLPKDGQDKSGPKDGQREGQSNGENAERSRRRESAN